MDKKEREQEFLSLVSVAQGSKAPAGFGYMDDNGVVDLSRPAELYVTCRMTHVFCLASLSGVPGLSPYIDHGVRALLNNFHDAKYGGWYSEISPTLTDSGSAVPLNRGKAAYAHAFVVLAAASAVAAGHSDADRLLQDALSVQKEHFVEEETGRVRESWDEAFTTSEAYRGINANMHTVESWLAASDVLNDAGLLDQAVKILHYVHDLAEQHDWRIPEHFSASWEVLPDYNIDEPAHPFRPYGVTPGHALEWARLTLHARAALERRGHTAEEWMLNGANALVNAAVADGWNVDGNPGFVYTTDFEGKPVVHERMHWVLCEAIGVGTVLARDLQEAGRAEEAAHLKEQVEQWWEYAETYVREGAGRWLHELDRDNQRSTVTWPGMPDIYHAAQMTLLPRIPTSPTFAAALRDGLLDTV